MGLKQSPPQEGTEARVPSQLHSQLCLHMCSTSHSVLQQPLLMFHYPSAASCQLAVKMSGDDTICFPIHSYSSHAGTALKLLPTSTGALQPVLEDGVAPAFPAGPTPAWLPPAAQAGPSCHPLPSQVTGKESLYNKCPFITCPTAEFSPLAQCYLCFSASQLATSLLSPTSSVGSEQDPHWQPEAGQPQLAANSLLLFLCQLSTGTSVENVIAASLYLQHKQWRAAPAFPISGLCICLVHCVPLGVDRRLLGLPCASGSCVH